MANNQTPIQEAGERLGESIPGISLMPKMVSIVDLNRRDKMHNRHVEDSHRQGMEAIRKTTGLTTGPLPAGEAEGEEMGDSFSVAGDSSTVHNHYYPAAEAAPASRPVQQQATTQPAPVQPATAEPEPAWKTWLKRAAIAAGGVGLGAGGLAGYDWLTSPDEKPPAVETPAVETTQPAPAGSYWKYGVKVRPPGE